MALTKATFSMIQGACANVLDFGADPSGDASSEPAFTAAIASLINGGIVYVPAGSYLIDDVVILDDNITIQGDGTASVILSKTFGGNTGTNGLFFADTKTSVGLRNLKVKVFQNYGIRSKFVGCRFVNIDNVFFDGEWQNTTDIASFPCWIAGSGDVTIQNCTFKDCIDSVYICRDAWDTGNDSYNVTVHDCLFYQENHGASSTYPCGIYVYYGRDTVVNNCKFRNIKPATTGSGQVGYGFYEGDGDAVSVNVSNCEFLDDDGVSIAYPMTAVLTATTETLLLEGCTFNGPLLYGAAISGTYLQVTGCTFKDCYAGISTYASSGVTVLTAEVSSCSFIGIEENPLIFGNSATNYAYSLTEGNHFLNCGYGAIYFRYTEYGEARDNVIVNCNTLNSTDAWRHAGINYYGCIAGLCDGNSVRNLDAAGQMKYGVSVGSGTNTVMVTPSNSFIDMRTGSVSNVLAAPPSTGAWAKGTTIHNWDADSAEYIGWVCTVAGTPGTWKGFGTIA